MVLFKDKTGLSVQDAFKAKPVLDDSGLPEKDEKGRPIRRVDLDPLSLVALVWLIGRKENPDFSFDDAMNVPAVELDVSLPEADPKD
ncbi:hypothetical protein [Kitasatospora sp. MBT66]|uniref:hypothetical protein n=1 Tax=Kitasatospora sp. MBT66 TaxID=1444769 RepID=UPI0011EA6EA4|nr:hypothetical protein [Kitasatospora sp. MBT66]